MTLGLLVAVPTAVFSGNHKNNSSQNKRVIVGFEHELNYTTRAYVDVQEAGGSIKRELGIINGMVLDLPEDAIENIEELSNVKYVEEDGVVSIMQTASSNGQEADWGVERIEAPEAWDTSTGGGVNIAVLDTGVDLNHPDLNVVDSINCLGGCDESENGDDDEGHGTHVAGTIAALDNDIGVVGVAHESNIYSVKVLDDRGFGNFSDIIAGIEWSVDNDADIINMSLGSSQNSESLREAVEEAYQEGAVLIAAAGNISFDEDTGEWQTWQYDLIIYPAGYEDVLAVAATNTDDTLPIFSQRGDYVEIAAPGVNINSTAMGGGYETKNGTSMAAPHVAGVAALIMASGDFSNTEVYELLINEAEDVSELDYPLVNALNSVNATEEDEEDEPAPSVSTHPLHRLYNPRTGAHFYTTSFDEAMNAVDRFSFNYEGRMGRILSSTPSETFRNLHRLYNPRTGAHFYTTSHSEAMNAVDRFNFSYEGMMGRIYRSSGSSRLPLHRLYNPRTGAHFYTTSFNEAMNAVDRFGFEYEGRMGYIVN